MATVASLAAVNLFTSPHFLWFLFPSAFMVLGVMSGAGRLWADGISLRGFFTPGKSNNPHALPGPRVSLAEAAQRLAPSDVLSGPYGELVRRAASDHHSVRDTLARLPQTERDMIPDVAPTVDALAERVGALATRKKPVTKVPTSAPAVPIRNCTV